MKEEQWDCPCGVSNTNRTTCRGCGTSLIAVEEFLHEQKEGLDEAKLDAMIQTSTTPDIPGHSITANVGVVTAQVVMGIHFMKDALAGLSDMFGGRSKTYEGELSKGARMVLHEVRLAAHRRGANGIVGLRLDYEAVGNSMLMVLAQGTAVTIEPNGKKRLSELLSG